MADIVQPPASSAVKISISQVFRVLGTADSRPVSCVTPTEGQHASCADIQKAIWTYKGVAKPEQPGKRIPAVLLHSNWFEEGTESNPWVDIVEPNEGYAIYNGDNRRSCTGALDARRTPLLSRLQHFYHNPHCAVSRRPSCCSHRSKSTATRRVTGSLPATASLPATRSCRTGRRIPTATSDGVGDVTFDAAVTPAQGEDE